jgi:hypothetical protein
MLFTTYPNFHADQRFRNPAGVTVFRPGWEAILQD